MDTNNSKHLVILYALCGWTKTTVVIMTTMMIVAITTIIATTITILTRAITKL